MGETKIPSTHFFLYDLNKRIFLNLYDGFSMGRSQGNHLFESDALVSSLQCKIYIRDHEIYIEDFSSNGTTSVSGRSLKKGATRALRAYEIIEFGNQRLLVTDQNREDPFSKSNQRRVIQLEPSRVAIEVNGHAPKVAGLEEYNLLSALPSGSQDREREQSSDLNTNRWRMIVSLIGTIVWHSVVYSKLFESEGLVFNTQRLCILVILSAVVIFVVGVFWHRLFIKDIFRSERPMVFALAGFITLALQLLILKSLDDEIGITSRIAQNHLADVCLNDAKVVDCKLELDRGRDSFNRLPASIKSQIIQKQKR